jgi:hypothetical protein|tara:strand:- start:893 stop:1258 length:366 start_codon:yes stop_codon:yes gene_type:complete
MKIKKLLITLILISPFSFADWGDVYYCQMTSFQEITDDGIITNYKLEKFQFKMDEVKQAMVTGGKGFLQNSEWRIVWGYPGREVWSTNSESEVAYFKDGKFLYVRSGFVDLNAITADCEKF